MGDDHRYLKEAYELTDNHTSHEIRALYDKWASVYDTELVDEQNYVMPARAAHAIAQHLDDKSAKILDVGCGTGLSGQALTHQGFSDIDGCDLSPGMLKRAEKTGIYGRLFEADLTAPPIDVPDLAYHAATVVGAFSYGHVPADAMDEILRTVKPGGLMLITVNDHYFQEGTITRKLEQLEGDGFVDHLVSEHGGHIEGLNVGGWVFLMRKI